ncbi:hypothetical protein J2X69_001298 [Algoriphagus sp. 4150]|uniref:hypothetical protein n=1 Tax=Algoriphagus sp. 4150 TaxID=2817756 RepID=UPI0028605952|nr:hypothetical protein [Algoriphagus sp. 4150]MDR7128963.1 hypothetical protein [Algoriphagus sp. 4150]
MRLLYFFISALLIGGLSSCGSGPEVLQEHTYHVNLSNGESYSGTIPNEELMAQYIDIPGEPTYRMITFNIMDGDFEMLVQVMMHGNTVLPIRDPESEEADGGFIIITPPGTDVFSRFGSISGSISASGLNYQETPGVGASTGLAMGEFKFTCQFQRAGDFGSDNNKISGTGEISIKRYF